MEKEKKNYDETAWTTDFRPSILERMGRCQNFLYLKVTKNLLVYILQFLYKSNPLSHRYIPIN